MDKIKVSNMVSSRGNKVPNQFIIETEKSTIFQSYDSIIAIRYKNSGLVVLGPDWEYSRTTGKYRNEFLRESVAETRAKLESGEYILDENL